MAILENGKNTKRSLGLLVLTSAIFALAASAAAPPQDEDQHSRHVTCTLETLKGRYLFAFSGAVLPPAFGVTEPTAGGAAGYHTFNGDGTGTDTVTVRVGSTITLDKVVAPITYTVSANCTGTYTVNVPDGPSFDLFIAPDGDEIATFATAPAGNQLASIDRRVSRK